MSDPFGQIGQFFLNLLTGLGVEAGLASFLLKVAGAAALATGCLFSTFFLIWAERKLLARLQDRLGPNRTGPFGMLQTIADFAKLVTKELIFPSGVDRPVFLLAPLLVVMSVVGIWAVVPFAPRFIASDVNVGVLYVVSVGSIGTLGIMLAGWSSNNKYALLGAFRTVAQLVSYEVPMVLVMLVPVMLSGSMGMVAIVEQQRSMWFVVLAPIAFILFYITSLAENGRAPFDLMEAESEIATGYNVEYSGLMFGMFFVAEFLHAFTIGALATTLFLGGWLGPGVDRYPLLGLVYFLGKSAVIWWSIIWVRMSLPRIRIDQMLALNWKFLTPLALGVVVVTAVADKVGPAGTLGRTVVQLVGNGVVLAFTLLALRAYAARLRNRPTLATPPAASTSLGAPAQ
ncbi:MAG TPA: NADH-quinone oxidoreductase subunit NuoH [Anaerolineales bacterium]|nr:NADH-quinone oxidoreductase subunit NuoH [Anaerolineales bacterium]